MSTDGWEQRLADLGQARELREAIRDEVAGWPIGTGYYSTTVGSDDAAEIADALLSGPLAPLLVAQAAVERVEALAERFGWDTMPVPDWTGRQVHQAIRRAVDGPT